ncbi:SusC/RagA family TonB-linked outer membrane protein [Pedobacter changchengzhani]|nr:TonB-dependent receptor [Pedobacter changchengzhani]
MNIYTLLVSTKNLLTYNRPKHWLSTFFVMMLLSSSVAFAQTDVTGTVTDQTNNYVEGANISSGSLNVISDEFGGFKINLKAGDNLIVSKKGFKTVTQIYKSKSTINVTLLQSSGDSTVNVAYGKQSINHLTASISFIDGNELYKTQIQNLSSAINGRLNGLTVNPLQSEPGSEFPSLNIRGLGSYNGNNTPLFFVDGFEAPYETLSAVEIETLSVFKDAAALAPFGVRGANGVIWVTTKRGEIGKTRINFKARTGFSQPIQLPNFVDSYNYASLYNEALSNDNGRVYNPRYSQADLAAYKDGSDPIFHPNINWYDQTLEKTIPNYEANLTFDGGTKAVKYFIALGYLNTPKLFKENTDAVESRLKSTGGAKRYNFRSNVDVTLNKVFDASISLGGSIQDRSFPNYTNYFDLLAATPPNVYAPINPDGSYGGNAIYPNNPIAALYGLGQRNTNARTLQTNFKLNEKLDMVTPGLSLSQEVAFLSYFQGNYFYQRDYARFSPSIDPLSGAIVYSKLGNDKPYSIDESQYDEYNRDSYSIQADYKRAFGLNSFQGMVNYRLSKYVIDGNNVPFVSTGFAGRLSYAYDEKYLAEVDFAYNGSDNFAPGKRFGFFPAASLGWILSKENFLKDNSFLNFLKLRSSIGVVGNDQIGGGRFLYQGYYFGGPSVIFGNNGNSAFGTLAEGAVGNVDVTWEKNLMFNVGLDAQFLNNQLQLTFDYFRNQRSNILSTRSAIAPAILGVALPFENLGKTNSSGVEFSLGYSSPKNKEFTYYVTGNVSYARTKIVNQEEITRSQDYLYRTGKSVNQPFGLTAIGFFQSQAEIDDPKTPIQLFGPVQPGDVKYKDQNNDGFINDDDVTAIGYNDVPLISGSLTMGAQYKGFDIMGSFYGVANRSIYESGPYFWAFNNNGQVPAIAEGRWAYYPDQGIDTRATANYPRLSLTNNLNNNRRSTLWTKNGNFLRLKNLEFGYTIPKTIAKKLKVENIRFYLSATNLFTFSALDDIDPEFPVGYPQMKNYQFGLNVKF